MFKKPLDYYYLYQIIHNTLIWLFEHNFGWCKVVQYNILIKKQKRKKGLKIFMERVKMEKAEDTEEKEINAYHWNGDVPHKTFQGKINVRSRISFMS